ncbi:hypothetical protein D9M69_610620 [compost metagenome]
MADSTVKFDFCGSVGFIAQFVFQALEEKAISSSLVGQTWQQEARKPFFRLGQYEKCIGHGS